MPNDFLLSEKNGGYSSIEEIEEKEREIQEELSLLEKMQQSPPLFYEWLKTALLGVGKWWGIAIIILFGYIFYATDSHKIVYFNLDLRYKQEKLKVLIESRNRLDLEISSFKKSINCVKSQVKRVGEKKETLLNYCK